MKGPLSSRRLCFSDKVQGISFVVYNLWKRACNYEEITLIMKFKLKTYLKNAGSTFKMLLKFKMFILNNLWIYS